MADLPHSITYTNNLTNETKTISSVSITGLITWIPTLTEYLEDKANG